MAELTKTKRSGDAAKAMPNLRLGPASGLVVANRSRLAALLGDAKDDAESVFEGLQARLGAPAANFPSMWPLAAELDEPDLGWLLRALDLLILNDAAAPSRFPRDAAIARLAQWAPQRTTESDDGDGSFESEALAVSGWAAAVLADRLTAPTPEEQDRLRAVYAPLGDTPSLDADLLAERLTGPLRQAVAEQAAQWAGTLESDDLGRLVAVADRLQTLVAGAFSPYPLARYDSPLYEGLRFADHLHSSMERAADLDAQVGHLYADLLIPGWGRDWTRPLTEAGFDATRPGDRQTLREVLREWLEADPEFSGQVADLIKHTESHPAPGDDPDAIDRTRRHDEVYLPTYAPAGAGADWRWRLVHCMIHQLLHQLAHPAFTAAVTAIAQREAVIGLLTAEAFAAAYDQATRDPETWKALAGDAAPNAGRIPSYGAPSEIATEIEAIAGIDRIHAAYFLGLPHLIGF